MTPPAQAPGPPPEGLVEGSTLGGDVRVRADVAVVGSGAAGGVVARHLAEAGATVVVLEEGGYYTRNDYGRLTPSESFRQLYRDRGLTVALGVGGGPHVPFLLGRAVGGSTVVNGAVSFRTPRRVLERWREAHGLDLDLGEMDAIFEEVEGFIHVAPTPDRVLGNNARVFARGAERLGVSYGRIARNVPECGGCCRCIFGCPRDAKLAVHLTYIPAALRAGARVYADARVDRVVVERGRATGVEGVILDRATGRPRHRIAVEAGRVVVAAGAIHTPVLLARSGLGGGSGLLGRGLMLHPSTRVMALFEERVEAWKGAMQGMYSDHYAAEGIHFNAIFIPPGVLATTYPGIGLGGKEAVARYDRWSTFGVMVSDRPGGRVRPGPLGGGPLVTYRLSDEDRRATVRGVKYLSRIYLAAGAQEVQVPIHGLPPIRTAADVDRIDEARVDGRHLEPVSQHPMGTCRMGADPGRSVLDGAFRLRGVEGCYVPDASFFPTSIGVNPQITVMAFATLCARRMVASA
ncbi:MAG: GMC family oxidoreductase [Planctomycetes bacterium]|nr:GMC family oxidoreductase [Planctomycetota bacterium]